MLNYRNIIKSRELRMRILNILAWIPDAFMLRMQYMLQMGHWLNLKKPKRYSEKIQYYKLFYNNPVLIQCVDKYDVREYVKSCGLGCILNDVYGIYDNSSEINFEILPEEFVCKDTLGAGSNAVILCRSKSDIDIPSLISQMDTWTSKNVHIKSGGREWPYYSGKNSRIIIEKLLKTSDSSELKDYKFFCFHGEVKFLYVSEGLDKAETASVSFLSKEWEFLPFRRLDYPPLHNLPQKPNTLNSMIEVAERLSKDFPHVRVDLYDIDGKIIFGELTFYNSSGYMRLSPDKYDFKIGEMFDICGF